MKQTKDIIDRLKLDFKKDYDQAIQTLKGAVERVDYLDHERIIRCIIYLSNGSLKELKHVIGQAKEDPRDVMLWAEYDGLKENETPKRIRDFNKTFEDCEKDVKE